MSEVQSVSKSPQPIFWQMVDPDAPVGDYFAEGHGLDRLKAAIHDRVAFEKEHTPDGYTPSGNLTIYWHEVVPEAHGA